MLFGGMPSMGHEFTMGKKDKVESWKTSGSIEATDNQVHVKTDMIVKGRDILQELDEIKHHMLLLPRNEKLERKYPELKEAYDAYMELYKGVQIARKMSEVE